MGGSAGDRLLYQLSNRRDTRNAKYKKGSFTRLKTTLWRLITASLPLPPEGGRKVYWATAVATIKASSVPAIPLLFEALKKHSEGVW